MYGYSLLRALQRYFSELRHLLNIADLLTLNLTLTLTLANKNTRYTVFWLTTNLKPNPDPNPKPNLIAVTRKRKTLQKVRWRVPR